MTVTMWGTYRFQGHTVVVTQQWQDPFGRAMIRIETTGPGPEQGIGVVEADFLREAVPVPGPPP
jgi:hypothetical protein